MDKEVFMGSLELREIALCSVLKAPLKAVELIQRSLNQRLLKSTWPLSCFSLTGRQANPPAATTASA